MLEKSKVSIATILKSLGCEIISNEDKSILFKYLDKKYVLIVNQRNTEWQLYHNGSKQKTIDFKESYLKEEIEKILKND